MSKAHSLFPNLCARLGKWIAALVTIGLVAINVHAQTTLGTQTLNLNAEAAGLLYGFPGSLTLSKSGSLFNSYTGSLTIQYRVRTTASVGTGSITAKASTDFTCASKGPCIATPPSTGDALSYTCTGATIGSNCSGTLDISTTAATNIVTAIPAASCTGGGSPCSTANPNTVVVNFSLTDDAKYQTGSYSATLILTISAT
jgi:hypothetical protein